MPDHKLFDPIPCVVTQLSTSIKIPAIPKKNSQLCEVVLKETGARGVLLNNSLLLYEGAEVIARFCSILPQGYYFLKLGIDDEIATSREASVGAKILKFSPRKNET